MCQAPSLRDASDLRPSPNVSSRSHRLTLRALRCDAAAAEDGTCAADVARKSNRPVLAVPGTSCWNACGNVWTTQNLKGITCN